MNALIIVLIFFTTNWAYSKELLYKKDLYQNINTYLSYSASTNLKDNNHQIVWNNINTFKPIETQNLVMDDVSETGTWVYFRIRNDETENKYIYLNFTPSYLGLIEIFDKNSKVNQTGSKIAQDPKLTFTGQIAKILLKNGVNEFLIKISSIGSSISVTAYSEDQFEEKKYKYDLLFFFLVGSISILCMYQLLVYVVTRKLIYLYYVIYSMSLIGALFTLTGYYNLVPSQILGSFPLGYLGSLFFSCTGFLALINFTVELLEVKSNKKYRYFVYTLNALLFSTAAYVYVGQDYLGIVFVRMLGAATILFLITLSVLEIRKNNANAKIFLISWSPFIAGVAATLLILSGKLSSNVFTDWILAVCTVIESLILAYALGKRLENADKVIIREQNLKLKAYEKLEENFTKLKQRDAIIKSYVSPTILTEVALQADPLKYTPKNIKKCILFCDIRDYTTLTEKTQTDEAVFILNSFFEIMNEAVFANNGEVDKLIGDAVMATFDNPQDCLVAVSHFREKFRLFNEHRVNNNKSAVYVGIGLSYGDVLSANFGSKYKLDRTIVGDVVNVASRFDGLSKSYKVDIICSESFIKQISDFNDYRPLDIVKVKGKSEELKIYEIFNHANARVREYKLNSRKQLETVLLLQSQHNYLEAIQIVKEMIRTNPNHTYKENEILDISLYTILNSLELKLQKNGVSYDSEKNAA